MKQSKEFKQNRTETENLYDIFFGVIFDGYNAKVLFLEGRLGTRLCLHPILKYFKYFLIFEGLKMFGNSFAMFFVLDIKYRCTCGESKLY